MVIYEADPDVMRWGLHLLYGENLNTSHEMQSAQLDDMNSYQQYNAMEPEQPRESNSVENDEMIAYTLQQDELAGETSGVSQLSEEHNALTLDEWISVNQRHTPECENNEDQDASSHEPEASSSSSPDRSQDAIENAFTSLELSDECSSLDGEVGKRLTQMNSVPHIPRTNRDIPTMDEAISDHQRLLDRLKLYDLVELKIPGDGNCQFRALSDQFYRTPEHHKFVRQQVVSQLRSSPEMYQEYVPMAYDEYLNKISKSGEWGDHVTLQAASDSYGVKICVVTSFKDTCFIEILPNIQRSRRVIFLSFWAEVHYNSIYPDGEVPNLCEPKTKKHWWIFGSRS